MGHVDPYMHRYVGPTTKWGLVHGAKVRIVGKRAGGVRVKAKGMPTTFTVGRQQVVKA